MRALQYLLVICVSALISTGAIAKLAKIQENLRSTVLVVGEDVDPNSNEGTPKGMGSGVIITGSGHIITNNHVIAQSEAYKVYLFDLDQPLEYKAELVGTDPIMDIAVLKIVGDNIPELTSVTWGTAPEFGEDIYMIGHPQGMIWTVSKGIVSNNDRYIESPWQRLIQSDSLIMPGNSGGPMFNESGDLVGINTSLIMSRDNTNTQAWSMSVHVENVRWSVDRLIQYGEPRRPALNVSVEEDEQSKRLIITPNEGSALQNAGLTGKAKLLKVDNTTIKKYDDLYDVLKNRMDGDLVNIIVEQDGQVKGYRFNLENWNVLETN
jgi:serine protease Do